MKVSALRRLGSGLRSLLGRQPAPVAKTPTLAQAAHGSPDDRWDVVDYCVDAGHEPLVFDPWGEIEAQDDRAELRPALSNVAAGMSVPCAARPENAATIECTTSIDRDDLASSIGRAAPDEEPVVLADSVEGGEGEPSEKLEEEEPEAVIAEAERDMLPSDGCNGFPTEAFLSSSGDDTEPPLGQISGDPAHAFQPASAWGLSDDGARVTDFDDFGAGAGGDWDDYEAPIDDYDPDAQQPLWQRAPEYDDAELGRARQKAATIASLVEMRSRSQQEALIRWLTELFRRLPHSATFRALLAAVERGIDGDTLREMAELRAVWADRPDWWVGRYGRNIRSIDRLRHGASALSWKLAQAICEARNDYPPELMIDDAWLVEWRRLEPGDDGFLSFPSYIGVRISDPETTLLRQGFGPDGICSDHPEIADKWDWYHAGRALDDPMRFAFGVLISCKLSGGPLGPIRSLDRTEDEQDVL